LLVLGILIVAACSANAATGVFPPTDINVSDDRTDGIQLTWTPAPTYYGTFEYQIRRSTERDRGSVKEIIADFFVGMQLLDVTPTPGRDYYYWMITRREGDDDALTTGQVVLTGPYHGFRPLAAPDGVDATDGTSTTEVTVTWNAVDGAIEYRVLRGTSIDGGKSPISDWLAGVTTFSDTTATAPTRYFYAVQARNIFTTGPLSESDQGWVAPIIPTPPTDVSASDGEFDDRVRVTWSAVDGATEYKVYRATAEDGAKTVLADWFAGTEFDDTTADPL
jgi:hypothetical protein